MKMEFYLPSQRNIPNVSSQLGFPTDSQQRYSLIRTICVIQVKEEILVGLLTRVYYHATLFFEVLSHIPNKGQCPATLKHY